MDAKSISRRLCREVDRLEFAPPVTHVYNPLRYARARHEEFLERHADPRAKALLLGMNPGPFGMAQTGVPFGEIDAVRRWLGIEGKVGRPENEHPKRPVQGFACTRNEVSGRRLWGWAEERFGKPRRFFRRFFVWNYCPLAFLEETGRNRTPDKLPAAERDALFEVCDDALRRIVAWLQPEQVVGIGRFAMDRAKAALPDTTIPIGTVLHGRFFLPPDPETSSVPISNGKDVTAPP